MIKMKIEGAKNKVFKPQECVRYLTLKYIDKCNGDNVTFGDVSRSRVKGKGTIEIPGLPLLHDVLYVKTQGSQDEFA
jgi:hypothetical protein